MNKKTRAALSAHIGTLEAIREDIQTAMDETQAKLDGISERAREGDKGQRLQEICDQLDTVASNLSDAISGIEEATTED